MERGNSAQWYHYSNSSTQIQCPQDSSTNGIIVNGFKIRRSSAILVDGDTLSIPNSQCGSDSPLFETKIQLIGMVAFRLKFIKADPHFKQHIFEPTPPNVPITKVFCGDMRLFISPLLIQPVGKYSISSHSLGRQVDLWLHCQIGIMLFYLRSNRDCLVARLLQSIWRLIPVHIGRWLAKQFLSTPRSVPNAKRKCYEKSAFSRV